jgi:transcriptional pleiotropic regulator of transition state genes
VTEPTARVDSPHSSGPLSSGMARKVDDLGRIVIPVEMRRMFAIQPGDELQIAVDGDCILLRKVDVRCVFCEGIDGLRPYRSKLVCSSCAQNLRRLGQPEGDLVDTALGDVELGSNGG